MNVNLAHYLAAGKEQVDQQLDRYLPAADRAPERLHQAMRYAMLGGGGKRIRPILALATAEALGYPGSRVMPLACALECIHTYSLIHDDLPAMDDDDLRRGRPSCHRAFDEATAILAGDALLTLAFEILSEPRTDFEPAAQLVALRQLANAAGVAGMVGGQMLDLLAENRSIGLPELQNIHIHKTGAMIRVACLGAATLCNATPEQTRALKRYGEAIGLAFQIMDDLLDEIGDSAVMGKATGSDRRQAKSTYPQLMGVTQAQEKAQDLITDALQMMDCFSDQADPLRLIARFIISRAC
ncbi:MAG: polyprenyl synthetase family protein [Magnetococcales bacterium]|nr:polyprenyl synthetase family protein [Magnetococcales bacterium]